MDSATNLQSVLVNQMIYASGVEKKKQLLFCECQP